MGHYPLAMLKKNIWNANNVFACYLCHADLVSIQVNICLILVKNECAKFCGLCAIIGLVHLVPLWHHAFASILRVQNFFLWVCCGLKNFSSLIFCGSKIFLVDILWVQKFFFWVFCGSKFFSCGYVVGLKFFLVDIMWVQFFFSNGWSYDSKIMRKNDCMRKSDRKVLHLLNYLHYYTAFIWTDCIFSYLFSSALR